MCQCLVCSTSDPHQPFEEGIIISILEMRKLSLEKLSDMLKVTQLGMYGGEIQIQVHSGSRAYAFSILV